MKRAKFLIVFMLLIVVTVLAGCDLEVAASDSYLVVDINPSLELVVNRKDKIVYASALNDDGETLLIDLELSGETVDNAVELIIDRCVELGYIDPDAEEITVNITSAGRDEAKKEKLCEKVCNRFNNSFAEKGMRGFAKKKAMTEELLAEAENLGITAEHLLVIQKVMILNPEMTLEDCLALPIDELIAMVRNLGQEIKDIVHAEKEHFFAERDGLYNQYKPLIEEFQEQIDDKVQQLTDQTDDEIKEQLQDELADLRTALKNLRDEYHDELDVLKELHRQNSQEAKERIREEFHARKEVHQENVEAFRNRVRERNKAIKEEIENWQKQQKGRP